MADEITIIKSSVDRESLVLTFAQIAGQMFAHDRAAGKFNEIESRDAPEFRDGYVIGATQAMMEVITGNLMLTVHET